MEIEQELKKYKDKIKIVFVDDDEIVRESTVVILEKFFDDIKPFSSAIKALEHIQNNPAEIVITDLKIADMDGVVLIKEIKKIYPHQRFIVLSGFIDDYAIHLKDITINALILKPYRLEKLLYAILKVSEESLVMKNFNSDDYAKSIIKRDDKLSANNYIDRFIDDDSKKFKVNFNIEQLIILNDELDNEIDRISKKNFKQKDLDKLSDIIAKMSNCLRDFNELEIIKTTLDEFSDILINYDIEFFNSIEERFLMIECLCIDIKTFIDNMFASKDVSDINYFSDSFKNNLEILKNHIGVTKVNDGQVFFL